MISLDELLSEQFTKSELKQTDVDTTFFSTYNSSAHSNFNILRCPNLRITSSVIRQDVHKDLDDADFDDTDSGLGDSTPPSPTWTYNESSEETRYNNDNSETIKQGCFQRFCYWETSDQNIDSEIENRGRLETLKNNMPVHIAMNDEENTTTKATMYDNISATISDSCCQIKTNSSERDATYSKIHSVEGYDQASYRKSQMSSTPKEIVGSIAFPSSDGNVLRCFKRKNQSSKKFTHIFSSIFNAFSKRSISNKEACQDRKTNAAQTATWADLRVVL